MSINKYFIRAVTMTGALAAGLFAADVRAAGTSVTELPVKEYDVTVRSAEQDAIFPRGVSIQGQSLEGMTLEEAKAWAQDYVQNCKDRSITLTVFTDNVFCYNGEIFGTTWDNPEIMDALSSYISDGNFVDQYKKQKDLDASPVSMDISLSVNQDFIQGEVEALCSNFYAAPVNASVRRENGAFAVSPEVVGRQFDSAAILSELMGLVTDFSNTNAIVYDLPYTEVAPQYTSADFNFSPNPLGSYSTGSLGSAERQHNITLSAQGEEGKDIGINGRTVYPGEEMSALDMYGPQTAEMGYLPAPGYEQGKQVTVVGGGVCQTTTTLYNALLRAELQITARSAHSMLVTYVPPALDAAVATGSKDLKFVNNLNYPIYLEAYVANGQVTVNIWGVDERPANREVRFEHIVESCTFPTPLYVNVVDDVNCKVGEGYKVWDKHTPTVETHPEVKARSYKVVYVDGVEQSREQLNYDYYEPMPGELHHASDCTVYSEMRESKADNAVYRYLGWTVYLEVRHLNGEKW